jgi:F0F1-type ATP synthase assembly protein I
VPPPRPLVRYARGAAIAFEFTSSIAVGAIVGWWVDEHWGTQPWGLTVSTLLATVGGFVRLLQVLKQFERLDRDGPT